MAKENAAPQPEEPNETAAYDLDEDDTGQDPASDDFFNDDERYGDDGAEPPFGVVPAEGSIDDDVAHEGPTGEGTDKESADDAEDGDLEDEEDPEDEDGDESPEEEEGSDEELTEEEQAEADAADVDDPEKNARHPQSLHEVTVNGETGNVTYDQLVVNFQKGAAADRRFEAAAEKEAGAKHVLNKFANKEGVLDNLIDFWATAVTGDRMKAEEMLDEVIAERVEKQIEREQMTPEARRISELEEEKERYEAEFKRRDEANAEAQRVTSMAQKEAATIRALDAALDAGGHPHDGPVSEALAKRLVFAMKQGHDIDDRVAGAVLQDILAEQRDLLQRSMAGMTPEQFAEANPELAEAVAKENIEKLRKRRKATNRSGTNRRGSTRGTPTATSEPRRRVREEAAVDGYETFFNDGDE